MLVKILCFWGIFSVILMSWDLLLGHAFGIFFEEFAREYFLATIAIFSFSLAYLIHDRDQK